MTEPNKSEAADKAAKDKEAKLQKSQTVKYSLSQTNGKPLHLCEDGEFRTDEDMSKLGVDE